MPGGHTIQTVSSGPHQLFQVLCSHHMLPWLLASVSRLLQPGKDSLQGACTCSLSPVWTINVRVAPPHAAASLRVMQHDSVVKFCTQWSILASLAEHGSPNTHLSTEKVTYVHALAAIPQPPPAPKSPCNQQQQHSGWNVPSQPGVKEPQSPGSGLVGDESTSDMLSLPSPGALC